MCLIIDRDLLMLLYDLPLLRIFLAVFFAKYFNMGAASILLSMGLSISLIDILLLYQSEIFKGF